VITYKEDVSIRDYKRSKILKADRCVVHVFWCYRYHCWEREDDADENCPQYASDIACQTEPSISHVERTRLEVHIWVVGEETTKGNGDNIREI